MCTYKIIYALLVALFLVIVFMAGMMSVAKGIVQGAKENPRQYYELKPIKSEYTKDVERIRRENGR